MSGSRSWNDALKASSRQPLAASRRSARELVASRAHGLASSSSVAAADADRPEEEPVPGELGVEPPRALGERREAVVAGREPDPGADRGDVVEVAPDALELEQDRARASELRGRREPERLLAGVRVGDAVRDRAGGAGARRRTRRPSSSVAPLGGPLEPAVLVEEARVEVEDPVADDVEAEVAGLDHAGVDRPDGDLVGVVRREPGRSSRRAASVVVDERAQRLVARRSRRRRGRAPRARPSRPRARGRRSTARAPVGARRSRADVDPSGATSSARTSGSARGGVQARRTASRRASAAATRSR